MSPPTPQPEPPQPNKPKEVTETTPLQKGQSLATQAIVVVAVLCRGQIVLRVTRGAQEKSEALELSTQLGTIEFGQSLKATVEAHAAKSAWWPPR